jgi:hypothetical protein
MHVQKPNIPRSQFGRLWNPRRIRIDRIFELIQNRTDGEKDLRILTVVLRSNKEQTSLLQVKGTGVSSQHIPHPLLMQLLGR